jgi:integrase
MAHQLASVAGLRGPRGVCVVFVKSNRRWLLLAHIPLGGEYVDEYLHLRDTRDNRRIAEKMTREIEAEIRAGTFEHARRFPNSKHLARLGLRAPIQPTLGEFALTWLEEQRSALTAASHNHYRLLLKNHLLGYPIAGKRVADVTDGDVNGLVGSLKEKFGENSGLRTINMVIARLRTIFATAKRRKLVADDPMKYVRNQRQPKPDVDPFDLNETLALVEAARGWERALIGTLIFTGVRPNEALALRWDKVDWAHNLIRVRDNVHAHGRIGLPKTEGSERDVEMIGRVRQLLQEQRSRSQLKGDLVLPSENGTPLDLDNFRARNWARIQRRAGMRPRPIYQCRHTFARLAIEHGDTPQHIAAQLGHSTVRMIFEVYGRWLNRPASPAMEALDRAVSVTHPSPIFGGESAGSEGKGR